MTKTSISWVLGPDGKPGFSWNPVVGCRAVSPGCQNCWAARLASTRLAHLPEYKGLAKDGKWTGGPRFLSDRLSQPLHKRKPAGIFVSDMGDLFHAAVGDQLIAAVFGVMAACPQHRFFLLTKRAQRMRKWFAWMKLEARTCNAGRGAPEAFVAVAYAQREGLSAVDVDGITSRAWPLPNVWIGTSIEDQATADERIPELLQTPAAVRWVSAEPLLGPVNLCSAAMPKWRESAPELSWLVCGGEAGPLSRPCRVEWIRSIVEQCKAAHVPVFVKQFGANCQTRNDDNFTGDMNDPDFPLWPDTPGGVSVVDRIEELPGGGYQGALVRVRLHDRAGADPAEWPADLRVRQFPVSA
jgi:protein gp37